MAKKQRVNKRTGIPFGYSFFSLLVASSLLSYSNWPLPVKFILFALGIVLPFWSMIREGDPGFDLGKHPTKEKEVPGLWPLWLLAMGGALLLRFYRVGDLSVWPVLDEGRNAYYSMELSRHWNWQFFRDISQMPPLYYWLQGLYFKCIPPSLYTMWLFPALLSLLTLPLAYFAVRRLFPRALAFIFVSLMAIGFYPAYVGRFNHQAVLLILWECLAFWSLSCWFKASRPSRGRWAVLLGLCLGTGFYIYFAWPFVVLGIGLILGAQTWKKDKKSLGLVGTLVFLTVLPLVVAALQGGYGSYIHSLWSGRGNTDLVVRINDSLSYFTALFWGLQTDLHAYKPFWGGYLNPVLDACCLTGLAQIWASRQRPFSRALLWLGAVLMLPAFLGKEIEMFRVVQVMPLLMFLTALGMVELVGRIPKPRPVLAVGILLACSLALDLYHLAGPYHQACLSNQDHWNQWSKSVERWKAYQILGNTYEPQGSVRLFHEFDPYPFDKSLVVAAAPLERSIGMEPKWCLWICNVNYQPFLARRFPEAVFHPLSEDVKTGDEGLMLVALPWAPYRETLLKWQAAEGALEKADRAMIDRPMGDRRTGVLRLLEESHPALAGDSFLESLFWNEAYLNHAADGDLPSAKADLEQALHKGYPTAYFYNELGALDYAMGDKPGAQEAFEKAVHSELNDTPAQANLLELQKQP